MEEFPFCASGAHLLGWAQAQEHPGEMIDPPCLALVGNYKASLSICFTFHLKLEVPDNIYYIAYEPAMRSHIMAVAWGNTIHPMPDTQKTQDGAGVPIFP